MTEEQFLNWQKNNPTFLMAHKEFLSKKSGYSFVRAFRYRWVNYEFEKFVFSEDGGENWKLLSTVSFEKI